MSEAEEMKPFVLATYREIAVKLGLRSGPNAARMKVKRSGWVVEPTNHPADTQRIRVPREVWEGVRDTPKDAPKPAPKPTAKDAMLGEVHTLRAEAASLRESVARLGVQLEEARMSGAVAGARLAMLEEAAERRRASWVGRLLGW